MKITVTKEHIDKAIPRDSHHCMIADAIHDVMDVQFVLVDTQSIRYSVKGENLRYIHLTPLSVQRALIRFDQEKPIKPFTFILPPVHQTRKVGWMGQGRRKKINRNKRNYKKTGHPVNIVAYRERAFGLRNIPK
jgi:hypothetical protein